jgi:uncharacterized protein (DUF1697 family)
MVALLRGVNVGGKAKLAMADLRRIVEGCGCTDVATYIQSGNVVLRSPASAAKVATDLRQAIADDTGLAPDVMVRTRAQLAKVVAANPFVDRSDDPIQLHTVFMHEPARAALAGVDLEPYVPEEAAAVGKELYLFLPGGIGRSKLAADLSRRGTRGGTTRNWRTVLTLHQMATDLP